MATIETDVRKIVSLSLDRVRKCHISLYASEFSEKTEK